MAKAQLILVGLALIAFFATGGIDKVSRAVVTAKEDFQTVKFKVTDFQQTILETNKAKGADQKTEVLRNDGFNVRVLNPQGLDRIQF